MTEVLLGEGRELTAASSKACATPGRPRERPPNEKSDKSARSRTDRPAHTKPPQVGRGDQTNHSAKRLGRQRPVYVPATLIASTFSPPSIGAARHARLARASSGAARRNTGTSRRGRRIRESRSQLDYETRGTLACEAKRQGCDSNQLVDGNCQLTRGLWVTKPRLGNLGALSVPRTGAPRGHTAGRPRRTKPSNPVISLAMRQIEVGFGAHHGADRNPSTTGRGGPLFDSRSFPGRRGPFLFQALAEKRSLSFAFGAAEQGGHRPRVGR